MNSPLGNIQAKLGVPEPKFDTQRQGEGSEKSEEL